MHRWACFCNTKALLLVSPSPSTWSALHPNAPWAEKPARRWLGSTERLEYRERETEEGREKAALRGSRENGVNHFSLYEKATELLSNSSQNVFPHTLYWLPKQWRLILTSDLSLKQCRIYSHGFLFVDKIPLILKSVWLCTTGTPQSSIWSSPIHSRWRGRLAGVHFRICTQGNQNLGYLWENAVHSLLVNTPWYYYI